jgi:hypothetical protein
MLWRIIREICVHALMNQQVVTPELLRVGQEVVAEAGRELLRGGNIVHLQLLASRFYDAVKAELEASPRHYAHAVGALAAAADQCRRSAQNEVSPHLMFVELRAAVAMLSGPLTSHADAVVRLKPQLRVIQGGRANELDGYPRGQELSSPGSRGKWTRAEP